MSASNNKVVVVGGGPVGLTAAIALEKAGIDFVLLERRTEIVIDAGSNLVLSPEGLQVLAQLGVLEAVNAVSTPLGVMNRVDHSGRNIGSMYWFEFMKEQLGVSPRVISRHDLTKVLYEALPSAAQAKVLPNKKLSEITPTESGAVATCTDGTSYGGSIVVGADGAHSMVRNLMTRLSQGEKSTEVEPPFLTTYRCLWMRFPAKSIPLGTVCETHGRTLATQLFAGEGTAVIGVYERLDKPTKERLRFTQADQDALVERWGHLPLTVDKAVTLREAYSSRLESGLVSLEEGVVDQWSWDGRIVLTGDAAHKFTPSTGAGCNNGIVDIVSLVNKLHPVFEGSRTGAPARQEMASAFEAYQDERIEAVRAGQQGSSQATASATWQTAIHKIVDRHVLSSKGLQRYMFGKGAAKTVTPSVQFGLKSNNAVAAAA